MTTKEKIKLICEQQNQAKIRKWAYDMSKNAKKEKTLTRHAKTIEECNKEIERINKVLEGAAA